MVIFIRTFKLKSTLVTCAFVFLVVVTFLANPENAYSKMNNSPYPNTPAEINALPKWAQIVIQTGPRTNPPEYLYKERLKLKKKYGSSFIDAAHHYAAALNWINRYQRSFIDPYKGVKADRKNALMKAISEFAFMRGRMKPTDTFYPMLLIKEAFVYKEQGNYARAQMNYQELLRLKPKHPMSYIFYADFMKSIGQKEGANEVLRLGLKKTDGSEIIKKALGNN